MVCRRYASTLRQTCFELFKKILQDWKIAPYVKINEGDMRITFPNGSLIFFVGTDEETKLLSLVNVSTIWVEETEELSNDMVDQLDIRLRGDVENQQIILSFNPITQNS